MGGSRSQPQSKPEPPRVDPMIAFMAMQQQQQSAQAAAAQKAQEEALKQSQIAAGTQAQQQGESAARSALTGMNVGQQAQDQATLAAQQKTSAPTGGASSTAAGDVGQYRQASLGTMGGQQGAVAMAANSGIGGTQQKNNQFQVPATTGLTFGGA